MTSLFEQSVSPQTLQLWLLSIFICELQHSQKVRLLPVARLHLLALFLQSFRHLMSQGAQTTVARGQLQAAVHEKLIVPQALLSFGAAHLPPPVARLLPFNFLPRRPGRDGRKPAGFEFLRGRNKTRRAIDFF